MKILGVDYGRARIGLAISEGKLATPYSVLQVTSQKEAIEKVRNVAKVEKVEKVVVGVSEGEMAKEQKDFAGRLRLKVKLPTVLWDETLSSQDAKEAAIAAGVPKEKRKRLEDAFAAALVLQSFLDNDVKTKDS